MGGQESKPKNYLLALELLSPEEQQKIQHIHHRISESQDGFSEGDLMTYGKRYGAEALMKHLFFFMKSLCDNEPGHHDNDFLITKEEFVVAIVIIFKGTPDERTELVRYLSCGDSGQTVITQQIRQLLKLLLECFSHTSKCDQSSGLTSWRLQQPQYTDPFSILLLHDLIYKGSSSQHDVTGPFPWNSAHTNTALASWLMGCPTIQNLLHHTFHTLFPISLEDSIQSLPLVPHVSGAPWEKLTTLLDLSSLIFLNQALLPDLRLEWRFLFSTRVHGESFSTMSKRIQHQGPSILIIEDTDGHVFGGFINQDWAHTSSFIGDAQCFLYSIFPVMEVYQPTGYNDHFMYMNQGQETIPNGLGMGGQYDYFGLWIDYEFGSGHSKAQPRCTTYNSPQLSAQEHFNIRTLEVWAVGPPKKTDPKKTGHGSILDKDPGAKAMLTLMGRGPHSEGLREEDATAESPEDHSMY